MIGRLLIVFRYMIAKSGECLSLVLDIHTCDDLSHPMM